MPVLNFDNPVHIVVALVAAAVTVLSAIRSVRIAVNACARSFPGAKLFPDRKWLVKTLRVLLAIILSAAAFPVILAGSLVRYPRLGYLKAKRLAENWRVWREARRPKPGGCINSRSGVAILVPAWAYDKAMAWHRQGVKDGYRLPDDKLVVRPAFIFYAASVPVGQKMRVAYSADETRLYQVSQECWVEDRPNLYVPFVSSPKQMVRDARLFSSIAPDYDEALRIIRNPK
jgi:hypothetical protein